MRIPEFELLYSDSVTRYVFVQLAIQKRKAMQQIIYSHCLLLSSCLFFEIRRCPDLPSQDLTLRFQTALCFIFGIIKSFFFIQSDNPIHYSDTKN